MINIDYYEILEVPGDADERMIKKAYYRLAKELHPDKASSHDEAKVMKKRFAQISAAYNILKNPGKRDEYRRRHSQSNRESTPTAHVLNASFRLPVCSSADPIVMNSRQKFGLTPEKSSIARKAYTRGMQCYRGKQFGKAIEFFETAIHNNGTEPSYYIRLGLTLIRAKKSAVRAVDLAQRAIKMDPYNISHKLALA